MANPHDVNGIIDSLGPERAGIGSENTMRPWDQATKHVTDHDLVEYSIGHQAVNLSPDS